MYISLVLNSCKRLKAANHKKKFSCTSKAGGLGFPQAVPAVRFSVNWGGISPRHSFLCKKFKSDNHFSDSRARNR